GLAGALRATLKPGDVVVARATRLETSSDGGGGAWPGRPAGAPHPPIAADERLVAAAVRAGAIVVESFLTVDRLIGRAYQKQALAQQGDAVDMESFAILRESAVRGIPAAAIRVIGDAADEDLPLDFGQALRADGTLDMARLLAEAARRPGRW